MLAMYLWAFATIAFLIFAVSLYREKNEAPVGPVSRALAEEGLDFDPQMRASAMVCITIFAFLCIFGACFVLFPPAWSPAPSLVFGVLIFFYGIAELMFLLYFFFPDSQRLLKIMDGFHKMIGTNLLKGWGGETFAEFTNGIGVLVAVGINLVFESNDGSYWWAGQLAALVSVMSAAAWVQRYVLEGPEKLPLNSTPREKEEWCRKIRSRSDYFKATLPNLLGVIASILTALAVLIPIEDNNVGRTAANMDRAGILWPWLIVFAIWGALAILPCFWGANTWPIGRNVGAIWNNREHMKDFLKLTFTFAAASLIFIIVLMALPMSIFLQDGSPWSDLVGWILGMITALIFAISQGLKVREEGKERRENPAFVHDTESSMRIIKDSSLGICSVVLLGAQALMIFNITQQWLQNEFVRFLYILMLVLMGGSSLVGVCADALRMVKKWDHEILVARARAELRLPRPQIIRRMSVDLTQREPGIRRRNSL